MSMWQRSLVTSFFSVTGASSLDSTHLAEEHTRNGRSDRVVGHIQLASPKHTKERQHARTQRQQKRTGQRIRTRIGERTGESRPCRSQTGNRSCSSPWPRCKHRVGSVSNTVDRDPTVGQNNRQEWQRRAHPPPPGTLVTDLAIEVMICMQQHHIGDEPSK